MPNKLSRFWQELKRRHVVRVVTVYTGAAFVILSLVDMIREPFELPNWSFKLVVVLLAIGLIIAVILSWIYDIHPEGGMVKTEPADKIKPDEHPGSSNSWKIATYVSVVIIIGLLAYNIFGGNRGARIDESLSKSIAVLIFYNHSGDPGQDYMCESLTDDIIRNLFKMASFDEVRPSTSVRPFQDPELSIKEIAQKLEVNYILEGSYRRMGDRILVSATLIEANSGKIIWSDDYNPPYNEIMGIPGEIAVKIANNLNAFISKDVKQSIDRMPTDNIEAYEYLGQAMNSGDTLTLVQRMELAEKAIELDPTYADAYTLVGYYKLRAGSFGGPETMLSAAWKALPYAIRSLELDQDLPGAHTLLGTIYTLAAWDYVNAEQEYLEALELEPNNSETLNQYLEFLNKMNRADEVLSINLKKLGINFLSDLAKSYILSGNRPEANSALSKYIDSLGYRGFPWVGECFLWMGEFDSAKNYLEPLRDSGFIEIPRFKACLALAYYNTNQQNDANTLIAQLVERSDTTSAGSPNFYVGWYYSGTGELDSAFNFLEKAYANRSAEFPWLKADPIFNSLKDDPRYWDLYDRTGHKAYDEYMARQNQ